MQGQKLNVHTVKNTVYLIYRKHNNQRALQEAKLNIERSYSVVGVMEQMEKSLHVMEHYMPRYFNGASDIYTNWSKVNSNQHSAQNTAQRH